MPNYTRIHSYENSSIELWTFDDPVEGELFKYKITGNKKEPMKTTIFINDNIVNSNKCEDPPCHEEIMIPPNSRGTTLKINIIDSDVGNIEHVFKIK
jgi:hypothetical protein